MNDTELEASKTASADPLDLQSLASFDFGPQWAKDKPGTHFDESRKAAAGTAARSREPRRADARPPRSPRPPRAPLSAGRSASPGGHAGRSHSPRATAPQPAAHAVGGEAPRERSGPPAPVIFEGRISLLPNQKALKVIIRKLQASGRCHPLTDICRLFMARPAYCDLKIEMAKDRAPQVLWQCTLCGVVSTSREQADAHARETHFDDIFVSETVQSEPPAGVFSCMARCGLSGRLLGPPNHHSYSENLRAVHQSLYPAMPMEEYTRRIETLHDDVLVEQWREQCRTQTVFKLGVPDESAPAEPMDRATADAWFEKNKAPKLVRKTKRAILPGSRIPMLKDASLRRAAQDVLRREATAPSSLKFALRGAFLANGMHVWKSPKGTVFVSTVAPTPLPLEHVVENVREILVYIGQHPRCSRQDILAGLRPGMDVAAQEARDFFSPLSWLIEKGHVLHFTDSTLCLALK
jgi:hypothetical protein